MQTTPKTVTPLIACLFSFKNTSSLSFNDLFSDRRLRFSSFNAWFSFCKYPNWFSKSANLVSVSIWACFRFWRHLLAASLFLWSLSSRFDLAVSLTLYKSDVNESVSLLEIEETVRGEVAKLSNTEKEGTSVFPSTTPYSDPRLKKSQISKSSMWQSVCCNVPTVMTSWFLLFCRGRFAERWIDSSRYSSWPLGKWKLNHSNGV